MPGSTTKKKSAKPKPAGLPELEAKIVELEAKVEKCDKRIEQVIQAVATGRMDML